ncbi:IucA/IucC family protein [Legionella clemsonensis]|uniref:Aerobactin synthase n=1 Tax=Legionella clemsonensis TaxID=1867846 RepID=A0A222NZ19_9GAMM|nr:IucA/IucC family protein [Legionella clemsonensis]ASQ44842.1 Aerobactin synthase [Legionella clemsonensis]
MALAYGDFHEVTHQLRFMLFEIGIGLPQQTIEYFITQAHRECLRRLQQAASLEGLTTSPINSHHIHDFIDQLQEQLKHKQPTLKFFNWQAFKHELDETVANEAMAQAYRQCWQLELRKQAKRFSNFWQWLCEKNNTYEILQLLEQWGCIGHPYYPNFRAKIGFSRREVLQYSPEFNAQINLHWCALHQRHTYLAAHNLGYKSLIRKHFPNEYQLWRNHLLFKQYNPDNYLPLPLHPWQWRNQIQQQFSSLIDSKALILLPHLQVVKPTMAFHTVMPQAAGACYLKLATAVQTVSANHTISQDSIDHGSLLALWLNHLLKKHDNYRQSLFIAADVASLGVSPTLVPASQCKQLAVILCDNPMSKQKNGQIPVPLGALFAQSPLSGKPLFIDILNSSGITPHAYFKDYCQKLLSGQLHLLLHYGIALEAHPQNTLIVFSNHRPVALIIKDLENACLCLHRFYEHVSKPKLSPDSKVMTENLNELVNKFIHGNFLSNIMGWIDNLSHNYSLAADDLWQIVHEEVRKQLKDFTSEINVELLNYYKYQLLERDWRPFSLLPIRLSNVSNACLAPPIFNPLSHLRSSNKRDSRTRIV